MSSIVVAGDTSGTITIAAPAVAGSGTLTLPVATDTLAGIAATQTLTNKTLTSPTITGATITVAATAAPAFSAYANVAQSVSLSTFTKVTFQVEDFDTNSNFASSTFTPTVAGYYQFNCLLQAGTVTTQSRQINVLYKNGGALSRIFDVSVTYEATSRVGVSSTLLAYANGTTDYFEMYGFIVGAGATTFSNTDSTFTSRFSASMVRSA